jgi:transcriptional regulator with XRE-family HTH domain
LRKSASPLFHLGDVVRKLREDRGWTLDDFIAAGKKKGLPISRMTLSDLENGQRKPRKTTLKAVARILGRSVPDLERLAARETRHDVTDATIDQLETALTGLIAALVDLAGAQVTEDVLMRALQNATRRSR